jgi:2-polyprenyl-3-methyl-5-hydroxy-6-metoxy-1,4-benzoquinol methylase
VPRPIRACTGPKLVAVTTHRGAELARRGANRVVDCEACGHPHLDPLPEPEQLTRHYGERYYEELNPGQLAKDRAERAYWRLEHHDRLEEWQALLEQEGGRLVDVGCSGGLLLETAAEAGWDVLGIEPSPVGVDECRRLGIPVRHGGYEDVALDGEVDVVHAKLVLEHLLAPAAFVAWAHRALRPGGLLTVQVPNDFNPLQLEAQKALGLESWWVTPSFDHINYFGFASLERLLTGGGFELCGRDATYPMEWFLLGGEDYVSDPPLGAIVHARRMALEHRLEDVGERRPLHRHLAGRGLGREAIVTARRPVR